MYRDGGRKKDAIRGVLGGYFGYCILRRNNLGSARLMQACRLMPLRWDGSRLEEMRN